MEKITSKEQMRKFDAQTIHETGISAVCLMERAAKAALSHLSACFETAHVLFLCGSGNNGGDGFAMARFFAEAGGRCSICYLGKMTGGSPDVSGMSPDTAAQYALLPKSIPLTDTPELANVTAVVDAVFGIGLCREIKGHIAEVLLAVRQSGIPVLAIDIPSGIDADTGAVLGIALPATLTVAIEAKKPAHVLFPGTIFCGKTVVAPIGITIEDTSIKLLEKNDLSLLLPRSPRSHKGTFGRVLIIGGSPAMSGAAHLAALAAYRAGAGLVEMLVPLENKQIHQILLPEAIVTPYTSNDLSEKLEGCLGRAHAIAIGMGLSRSEDAKRLVAATLNDATVPAVFDADALNLLASDPALLAMLYKREHPSILTPHLAEMSRLAGKPLPLIGADMVGTAKSYAQASGTTVVLKDARTVISDGECSYLNAFGNSGMATGGSGDVLAGIIAATLAAGNSPTLAAALGVLTHALAGDTAKEKCGESGMMASDIIKGLCRVLP